MGKRGFGNRITTMLLAALLAAAALAACTPLKEVATVVEKIAADLPSEDDTMTSLVEITRIIEDAMSRGETEITYSATGVSEDDLKNIGKNLSSFWGKPVQYTINSEFKNLDSVVPGKVVDVQNITNIIELSDNYYIYRYMRTGTPIPGDRPQAQEIADALDKIIVDLFPDDPLTDYDKALAVHDWLVLNIEYDDEMREQSENNTSYGAIISGRTMCMGYAEAFELMLKCYTDVEVVQISGDAVNSVSETWAGHAWNAIKLDGFWYHVDVTYDDPKGDSDDFISRFYFGQSDEVMEANHRWEREYFPTCTRGDFLYFRQSGLFAADWESFEVIFKALFADSPFTNIELAVRGDTADKDNLQFIYDVVPGAEEIWWSENNWRDINVYNIEVVYSE